MAGRARMVRSYLILGAHGGVMAGLSLKVRKALRDSWVRVWALNWSEGEIGGGSFPLPATSDREAIAHAAVILLRFGWLKGARVEVRRYRHGRDVGRGKLVKRLQGGE